MERQIDNNEAAECLGMTAGQFRRFQDLVPATVRHKGQRRKYYASDLLAWRDHMKQLALNEQIRNGHIPSTIAEQHYR